MLFCWTISLTCYPKCIVIVTNVYFFCCSLFAQWVTAQNSCFHCSFILWKHSVYVHGWTALETCYSCSLNFLTSLHSTASLTEPFLCAQLPRCWNALWLWFLLLIISVCWSQLFAGYNITHGYFLLNKCLTLHIVVSHAADVLVDIWY